MPASEEFYRDQKGLNVWFLWTSLALFGATIWMLAVDHNLPWKKVQLDFLDVKRDKLRDDFVRGKQRIDETKLADLKAKLTQGQQQLAGRKQELQAALDQKERLKPKLEISQRKIAFQKAFESEYASSFDLDREAAQESKYEGNAKRAKRFARATEADLKKLAKLQQEIVAATAEGEKLQDEMKAVDATIAAANADVERVEKDIRDLNKDVDALDRSLKNSEYTAGAQFRALPVIDGFASPFKVKQTAHPDLPLNYNFSNAIRFDRCMTCHLGIDQKGFSPDTTKQPYCSHPRQDLYVDSASPHPVEKFGCTVCHQGQGTATSFDWASHTPNESKQRKEWSVGRGWFFNEFHELPMLPKRFTESSCLKCHHDPYQIPQASKLLQGYQLVRSNGCFGCHEIAGFKDDGAAIGPNLRIAAKTDSAEAKAKSLRKVGPNLVGLANKLGEDFVAKWIRNPQAFRPSSTMPQFYHQMDRKDGFYGDAPAGEFDMGVPDPAGKTYSHDHKLGDLANIEVVAMSTYLLEKSKERIAVDKMTVPAVPGAGDVAKGKTQFMTKGCVACHVHKEHVDQSAKKFGPNLSEIAAKFTTEDQKKWLRAWIKNPTFHNPESYMPNLYLADDEVANIAAYLLSVPAKWETQVSVPSVAQLVSASGEGAVRDPLRDLLLMNELKDQKTRVEAAAAIDKLSTKDRLVLLGQKTIGRLGCFACHNIPGFEDAKPIGVGLNDWGRKDNHKLTFENVHELVKDEMDALPPAERAEHFYSKNDYYTWAMHEHQREGFLMQKLREPRGYDYKKIRRWEDRARMPKFNLTDAEREAVATFILGLVGEEVNRKYVYNPPNPKKAEYEGRNLLDLYNCTACHVVKPGEYKFTPNEKMGSDLLALAKKELDADYSQAFIAQHNAWAPADLVKRWQQEADAKANPKQKPPPPLAQAPLGKEPFVLRGLPEGTEPEDGADDPTDLKSYFRLWYAAGYQGQPVPAGIKVGIPKSQLNPANVQAPLGGSFAFALVDYLLLHPTEPGKQPNLFDPSERDKSWAKSPPPLIREGEKVQTPWLYSFLRDPYPIRKTVVLRMPKFNFRDSDVVALANYFAAADSQPFPYIEAPEREETYLAKLNARYHDQYLESAFKLVTNKELCVKCHDIGGVKAAGKPEELGPSLARAQERLRPDWMMRWIANPKRFVPYTGMPVNFPKDKLQYQDAFKATNLDQIQAARDLLVNYSRLLDHLMTKNQPTAAATPAAPAVGGKGATQ